MSQTRNRKPDSDRDEEGHIRKCQGSPWQNQSVHIQPAKWHAHLNQVTLYRRRAPHSLSPELSVSCSNQECKRQLSGANSRELIFCKRNSISINKRYQSEKKAELLRLRDENRYLRLQHPILTDQNVMLQKNMEALTIKMDETVEELKKMHAGKNLRETEADGQTKEGDTNNKGQNDGKCGTGCIGGTTDRIGGCRKIEACSTTRPHPIGEAQLVGYREERTEEHDETNIGTYEGKQPLTKLILIQIPTTIQPKRHVTSTKAGHGLLWRCEGPDWKAKKALLKWLPRWEVLSIRFIGAAVTEIMFYSDIFERLVATMCIFRYHHLSTYDPTTTISETISDNAKLSYKASYVRLLRQLVTSELNPAWKTWY